jgi:hypothetical protein
MVKSLMNYSLIRDICALARRQDTLRGRLLYLVRGFIYLPFLMRDFPSVSSRKDESTGIAPQFDDIYPLF